MIYRLIKLKFENAVCFGNEKLWSDAYSLSVDTIFSALCKEALLQDEAVLYKLLNKFYTGKILLSDAMPYDPESLFVPVPLGGHKENGIGRMQYHSELDTYSFLPAELMDDYLNAELSPTILQERISGLGGIGKRDRLMMSSQMFQGSYSVHVFDFNVGCGLYICISGKNERDIDFVLSLFNGLSYSGLGGKRSIGLGRFHFDIEEMPGFFMDRLDTDAYDMFMTLSISLPKEEELEHAMEGAGYSLVRKGGYVDSERYGDAGRAKKGLCLFEAGSVFHNRFEGGIYDVSNGGAHPVFRYAKPMFMGIV